MEVDLQRFFTMTVRFDRNLQILDCSERFSLRYPAAREGLVLTDFFDFHRPLNTSNFEDVVANQDSLFLLVSKDHTFALRGQIYLPEGKASNWGIFLGSPWLLWMMENQPDIAMEMADFPKHDAQMDHSFYISSQQSTVKDLERLNVELRTAHDAARQAEKARASFFAVMSHEMRTPLNGVISSLSLLDDTADSAARDKLIKVALSSADNLMSVVNYVLDYSKIEAGKLELEMQTFDLKECINSVAEILHTKASRKGLELSCNLESGCPRWVIGDHSKLRQILINLVSNAVKFTEKGSVELHARLTQEDSEKAFISFTVMDTGIGISEQDKGLVFTPFWSSNSQTTTGDDNTGLGLSICARMVDLLKGDISFESESGKGTRFTVLLPFIKSNRQALPANPEPADDRPSNRKFKGKILLVDDNQTNLMVGSLFLERMGLHVRTATSGSEAIEIALHMHFDLVLMDITMPEMNGMEATSILRTKGYQQPVIALTAHIEKETQAECFEAGMQHVLYKPLDQKALSAVLVKFLPEDGDGSPTLEPAKPDSPTFNNDTFQILVDAIGKQSIPHVHALFVRDSTILIQKIQDAWEKQDMNEINIAAHTLKSNSALFGAEPLSYTASEIEIASRKNDAEQLQSLISEIAPLHAKFLDLIDEQVKQFMASEPG